MATNYILLDALMKGTKKWDELTNDDFYYDIKQKQVDIKLGMDITTLAYEKLVDVIVLVAGDSDFVPAAKHARIKGIDFILDPLRQNVTPSLSEHIDGVQSYSLISGLADALHVEPDPAPDWWEDRKKASLGEKTIAVNAGMETLKLSLQRNIKEINDNPINPTTEPGFLCLTIAPPKNT